MHAWCKNACYVPGMNYTFHMKQILWKPGRIDIGLFKCNVLTNAKIYFHEQRKCLPEKEKMFAINTCNSLFPSIFSDSRHSLWNPLNSNSVQPPRRWTLTVSYHQLMCGLTQGNNVVSHYPKPGTRDKRAQQKNKYRNTENSM